MKTTAETDPDTPCGFCGHRWASHRPPEGALALPGFVVEADRAFDVWTWTMRRNEWGIERRIESSGVVPFAPAPKLGPMCRVWGCRCEMFAEEG